MRWMVLCVSMLFSSCWFLASTDVDNEIKVAAVGTVTTGVALSHDTVKLYDQNGELLGTDVSDSLGQFEIKTQAPVSRYQGAWTIRSNQTGLRMLLPKPDPKGRSYALLSPLSNYVYGKVGTHSQDLGQFQHEADSLLADLLGQGFAYSSIANSKDYRSLNQNAPDPLAALMYQLNNLAHSQGMTLDEYLDAMTEDSVPLLQSQNFLVGLVNVAKQRGIDTADLYKDLQQWVGVQQDVDLSLFFKPGLDVPRSPQLSLLKNEATVDLVMEGYGAFMARFAAMPPGDSLGYSPSLDSVRLDLPYIWPYVDTLMIRTGQEFEKWAGLNPVYDDRARFIMNNLGERLGACVSLYQPQLRKPDPSSAVGMCNRTVDKFLSRIQVSNWVEKGDSSQMSAFLELIRPEVMRNELELQIKQYNKTYLLPLRP